MKKPESVETQAEAQRIAHSRRLAGTQIYALPISTRQVSRVTIYSQQVRALNLVWARDEIDRLEAKRIVVIGGGIGGMTVAAAAALWKAHVTPLEQAEE